MHVLRIALVLLLFGLSQCETSGDPLPGADAFGEPSGDAAAADSAGEGDAAEDPSYPEGFCYTDEVHAEAALDDLEAAFTPENALATAYEVLRRRYPAGLCVTEAVAEDPQWAAYLDTGSWSAMILSLETFVHESVHGYAYATWSDIRYFVACDRHLLGPFWEGFPRSEILDMVEPAPTEFYDDTYLVQIGSQGWDSLLDEWNAYITGALASALVADAFPPLLSTSALDGPATFTVYLEMYLRRAREAHPDVWEAIRADERYLAILRTNWLKLQFLLTLAEPHANLGIDYPAIAEWAFDPENVAEIEAIVGHPLPATPCP